MIRKILSLVLSFSIIIGTVSTFGIISFAENEVNEEVLFYTSFDAGNVYGETTRVVPLKGVYDLERNENVSAISPNDWFNSMIDSVESATPIGSRDANNLLDNKNDTSYMTSAAFPIVIKFNMKDCVTAMNYAVVSANNANANAPMDWTFEGSKDGEKWTVLSTVEGQTFTKRAQTKRFIIDTPDAYLYYRMVITKRAGASGQGEASGSLQFAELSVKETSTTTTTKAINSVLTELSTGPETAYAGPANKPWKGEECLIMTGTHNGTGRGYANSFIFQDLNYVVTEDMYLNYVIFPDFEGNKYDYDYTSQYASVDLMFTDGTYLSDLGAIDQNGHGMSARAQGESKSLYQKEWNFIECNIGKFAAGKTISKIVISYDKPNNENGVNPITFFDDIKIYKRSEKQYDNLVKYVDTRRGTNDDASNVNRGVTFPAICLPNSFNLWTPSTSDGGRKLYNYHPSNKITHMMISHEASIHLLDYCAFMFMPNTNQGIEKTRIDCNSRKCAFDHDREIANANYYSVIFDNGSPASGVKLELTPTDHAAVIRMAFPEDSENVNMIFDNVSTSGSSSSGSIEYGEDGSFKAIIDYGSSDWNVGYPRMYVYGKFDKVPVNKVLSTSVNSILSMLAFEKGTTELTMKIATSYMSLEQAEKNLQLEVGEASFDEIRLRGEKIWNDILGVVEVEGASEEERITLYSNLYRMYVYPTNFSENIGTAEEPVIAYTSPYKSTHTNPVIVNGQLYTTNGFWDTYRTVWAAYALLTPEKDGELLNGFVQHYKDSGWVGRWLNPAPVNSMCGTSSDIIFGDACVKGIEFDYQAAYESAIRNSSSIKSGNAGRVNNNSSPFLWFNAGNVPWTMESAINDYGVAQLAKKLGYDDEYNYYLAKAKSYVNNFNPNIDFFQTRRDNGDWRYTVEEFDPRNWDIGYCETNAWGTAFAVTQDAQGLANLYGGREGLAKKLDALLEADPMWISSRVDVVHEMYEAREVRMGQYQHSNQPSHHILYMYSYANQPYKTQALTREVLDRLYVGSSFGQGYLGDEDNGEMSAWYVLSSLGFYPMNMGSGEYVITSPLYKKTILHLPTGDITITAENNSHDNVYIQSMSIDGKYYDKCYISHADLLKAKDIKFVMGDKPSTWATDVDSLPSSLTAANEVVKTPDDISKNAAYSVSGTPSSTYTLFDNNSTTSVYSDNNIVVNFTFPKAETVEMITVTNGSYSNQNPSSIALYGSKTGEDGSYVELINKSDVSYLFSNTVMPFVVNKPDAYMYYRLEMKNTSRFYVSEVELLSNFHEYKEVEKGDYDLDGTVSVADALSALRASLGFVKPTEQSIEQADMNNDNHITVVDAMLILRKAAGLDIE